MTLRQSGPTITQFLYESGHSLVNENGNPLSAPPPDYASLYTNEFLPHGMRS